MNSVRTLSVTSCAIWKNDVWFSNDGMPIVRMYAGRKLPRPASAYPHPFDATATATTHVMSAGLHDDNINQFSLHHNDRFNGFAVDVRAHGWIGQRTLAQLAFRYLDANGQPAPEL